MNPARVDIVPLEVLKNTNGMYLSLTQPIFQGRIVQSGTQVIIENIGRDEDQHAL